MQERRTYLELKHVTKTGRIGNVVTRNRLVMPAMCSYTATVEGTKYLIERGIVFVGIDTPLIDQMNSGDCPVHDIVLGTGGISSQRRCCRYGGGGTRTFVLS